MRNMSASTCWKAASPAAPGAAHPLSRVQPGSDLGQGVRQPLYVHLTLHLMDCAQTEVLKFPAISTPGRPRRAVQGRVQCVYGRADGTPGRQTLLSLEMHRVHSAKSEQNRRASRSVSPQATLSRSREEGRRSSGAPAALWRMAVMPACCSSNTTGPRPRLLHSAIARTAPPPPGSCSPVSALYRPHRPPASAVRCQAVPYLIQP